MTQPLSWIVCSFAMVKMMRVLKPSYVFEEKNSNMHLVDVTQD